MVNQQGEVLNTGRILVRRRHGLAIGLLLSIFMLAMGLRLLGLDQNSLSHDEIITANISTRDVVRIVQIHLLRANPPLLSIVTHFSFLSGGRNEFMARLPAAIFGSLSILMAYKLGETLWTSMEGLMGALLLSFNAYHVRYSQEARYYSLMVFLALLSLILLLKAVQKNDKRMWIGFVVCTSLGLYNHYFALLLLPAQAAFGTAAIAENWLSYRRQAGHEPPMHTLRVFLGQANAVRMFCVSLGLIGLLYLPWLPALQAQFPKQLESGAVSASTARLSLSIDYLERTVREFSGVEGAGLVLFLGLFAVGLVTCRRKWVVPVALWIVIPFAFLSVVEPGHFAKPKYVLFILPMYLLLIARGGKTLASWSAQRLPRGGRWLPPLSSALTVLIIAALNVTPLRDYYASQTDDYRSAAGYLADNMMQGDIVLVDGKTRSHSYGGVGDSDWVLRCLPYYLKSPGITMKGRVFPVKRGLWEHLQDLAGSSGQAWAVIRARPPIRRALLQEPEQISVVRFKGLSILRLRHPGGDVLGDSVSMLEMLLQLLPTHDLFDVHLALAEIHLHTGRTADAASHVELAALLKPDQDEASTHLAAAYEELELTAGTQQPHGQNVGDVLALLGHDIRPRTIQPGGTLGVTLQYAARAKMDRDYTAFIHLVDTHDRMWAQGDRLLQHGDRPTSTWVIGETVTERHNLQTSFDVPPGEYVVKVGVYYWETGERLPIWDQDGERVAGDAVLLEPITVTE